MSLQRQCDRCGVMSKLDTSVGEKTAFIITPTGWGRVCGTDLCEKCSEELHKFLRPIGVF